MMTRYESIATHIAGDIQSGLLAPGERLPSLRSVCEREQVSLMTALAAYRRLEALQLVEALPRSGYRVRAAPMPRLERPATTRTRLVSARSTRATILHEVLGAVSDPALVPLGLGCPASDLYPLATLRRSTGRLLAARPELWTTYSLPPGSAELRRLLAQRLSARQLRVRPEQLLIANGAMEAMFLALRAVIEAGDVVAVECPTFFGIHDVLQSVGARVLELPGHPQHGIEPERLAAACREHHIKAAVLMPSFANPSGANMPDPQRAALARVLADQRVALIEDDLYGELSFDLRPPTPLSAWLLHGKTPCFLVSSFSKTLLPAGRVGYLAASSPWLERVTELKRVTSLATAGLPEQLAAECLANGVYDRHLRRMIPRLQQRVRSIEHLVAQHFPAGTRSSHPPGGFLVWLELPPQCSGERLFWAARKAGIGIVPGSVFSLATSLERFVRLSAGSSAQLESALLKLGKLARSQLAGA